MRRLSLACFSLAWLLALIESRRGAPSRNDYRVENERNPPRERHHVAANTLICVRGKWVQKEKRGSCNKPYFLAGLFACLPSAHQCLAQGLGRCLRSAGTELPRRVIPLSLLATWLLDRNILAFTEQTKDDWNQRKHRRARREKILLWCFSFRICENGDGVVKINSYFPGSVRCLCAKAIPKRVQKIARHSPHWTRANNYCTTALLTLSSSPIP